jgi:hypothetical protein
MSGASTVLGMLSLILAIFLFARDKDKFEWVLSFSDAASIP